MPQSGTRFGVHTPRVSTHSQALFPTLPPSPPRFDNPPYHDIMSLHFCLLTGQLLTLQLEAGKETGHRDPTLPAPPVGTPTDPFWANFQTDGIGSPPPHFLTHAPHLPPPGPPHPFPGSKCPWTIPPPHLRFYLEGLPPHAPGAPPSSLHAGGPAPSPQRAPPFAPR